MRDQGGPACRLLSLPMYDLPELGWAHDALCDGLLAALAGSGAFAPGELPERRQQPGDLASTWRDPALLLSQTCGYPLVTILHGQVRTVATPVYSAEGCSGAFMTSALVVRRDEPAETLADLRGHAVCALNGYDSNSGMNLLRATVAPLAAGRPFFRAICLTGAHVRSVAAVSDGRADIAAIDCVTWALLQRERPLATARLRVLDWTQASPGLPLVTSRTMSETRVAALHSALDRILRDPGLQAARRALLIERFERLDDAAYARVSEIERQAAGLSYPVLQ